VAGVLIVFLGHFSTPSLSQILQSQKVQWQKNWKLLGTKCPNTTRTTIREIF